MYVVMIIHPYDDDPVDLIAVASTDEEAQEICRRVEAAVHAGAQFLEADPRFASTEEWGVHHDRLFAKAQERFGDFCFVEEDAEFVVRKITDRFPPQQEATPAKP